MNLQLQRWLQISLFNLLLVAIIGVVMRYKIAYALPIVDQKNFLHAHSHFAFAGWLTQALMSLLISKLPQWESRDVFLRYRPILYANLMTAYGMLFSFPFQGYGFFSILFSTLSIFVSYWFAVKFWNDLNKGTVKNLSYRWFKAAVIFNALSSVGAFSLAYMLAVKTIEPEKYLASVYFFLHFQYNGWFFFACMGLLTFELLKSGIGKVNLKKVYFLFVSACAPAYFLSALWLPVPKWVYALIVIAVIFQLIGWIWTILSVKRNVAVLKVITGKFPAILFLMSGVALTIKLCLQAGSVIPSLSRLAFGFRPIVIGYLHLVLLGVITLFLLAYITAFKLILVTRLTKYGIIVFVTGILLNEILLMVQGIADLSYVAVPLINPLLLIAAMVLFLGMLLINYAQRYSFYDHAHKSTGRE